MKAVLFYIIILISLSNGCYIVNQGYYQVKMLGEMKPFHKVLYDPKVSLKVKKKILLVMKVKRFAIQTIGLKQSGSYSHYVKVNRPYVAYNVSAAPKDRLEPLIWQFPIIGKVPYLGFFNKKDAVKEEASLKARGFDTRLRGVPAYSTLGFFNDPFLSTMVKYPDSVIIEIIIHEMTHETIFLRNNVKFNEGLATFVGNKGALRYIEKVYGKKSKWAKYLKDSDKDSHLFSKFIRRISKNLTALYKLNISKEEKIKKRELYFKRFKKSFETKVKPKLKTNIYKYFNKIKLNNAVILSYKRYYHDLTLFEELYRHFNYDLKRMIVFLKRLERVKADPEKVLAFWLKQKKR